MSKNRKSIDATQLDFADDRFIEKHLPSSQKIPAKVRKLVRDAKKYQAEENWPEVVKCMNIAWEYAPDNLDILMVLAYSLSKLGVRDKAIKVIEHALARHKPNALICRIMGMLAIEMGMDEIGVKLWRIVLQFEPNQVDGYVNLITSMKNLKQYDQAIEVAQGVLPHFPQSATLWNVLATVVKARDGSKASLVFYEEALKHEPDNAQLIGNYAFAIESLEPRICYLRKALALDKNAVEVKIGLATTLMLKGELVEAFTHYEARQSPKRKLGQHVLYTNKIPVWTGEPLKDKTLLIMNEQGIGDEILFANNYPRIIAEAGRVILTCDFRLKELYKRSFPDAEIYVAYDGVYHGYTYRSYRDLEEKIKAGEEHVDYAIPLASIPKLYWKSPKDVPSFPVPMLKPEPGLAKTWRKRVGEAGENLKVGLSWASGKIDERSKALYLSINDLAPLFELSGIDFYNLQYSNFEEGIDYAREKYGVTIHHWQDFDVKKDIEANIALMSNLDVTIGPGAAPQMFSAAAGTPTWWLLAGAPWWLFGSSPDEPSIYTRGKMFIKDEVEAPWAPTIDTLKDELIKLRDEKATHG